MRKYTSLLQIVVALSTSTFFYSCQKSIDQPALFENNAGAVASTRSNGVTPYQFERINEHNFSSQGWREQQVNIVSGVTIFSDEGDHLKIVCGPENNSDRRLIPGCVTMNLPTGADPTLRRIRLRRAGYSGTLLSDLTELKFSTYVIRNAPTNMVLQIDVNGDATKDFNIFYDPRPEWQAPGAQPFVLNQWQQWNALAGRWYTEISTISGLPVYATIAQLATQFPTARIIDTPPVGNNGEGVRFTIGGTPRSLFDNTIGYFDALIIGTRNQQHSTLFDFTCSQGND